VIAATLVIVAVATATEAQQLHAYPQRGQSAEQQARDKSECQGWAAQQPGASPMTSAPPPPSTAPPQGEALRGAARGAAVGAVGGAIGGDAGKGAAIGAATGAVFGGLRRASAVQRDQEAQTQAQNAQVQNFSRAYAACLQARGYSVQ
jgi:hypothetical protein